MKYFEQIEENGKQLAALKKEFIGEQSQILFGKIYTKEFIAEMMALSIPIESQMIGVFLIQIINRLEKLENKPKIVKAGADALNNLKPIK